MIGTAKGRKTIDPTEREEEAKAENGMPRKADREAGVQREEVSIVRPRRNKMRPRAKKATDQSLWNLTTPQEQNSVTMSGTSPQKNCPQESIRDRNHRGDKNVPAEDHPRVLRPCPPPVLGLLDLEAGVGAGVDLGPEVLPHAVNRLLAGVRVPIREAGLDLVRARILQHFREIK